MLDKKVSWSKGGEVFADDDAEMDFYLL